MTSEKFSILNTLSPNHYYGRLVYSVATGKAGREAIAEEYLGRDPLFSEEYSIESVCHAIHGHNHWAFKGLVEHFHHSTRLIGFIAVLDPDGNEYDTYPYERVFPEK